MGTDREKRIRRDEIKGYKVKDIKEGTDGEGKGRDEKAGNNRDKKGANGGKEIKVRRREWK